MRSRCVTLGFPRLFPVSAVMITFPGGLRAARLDCQLGLMVSARVVVGMGGCCVVSRGVDRSAVTLPAGVTAWERQTEGVLIQTVV